jgi:hypothetical protein
MPKLYYLMGAINDTETYIEFAESNGFDAHKSVFLFPSNTSHHTKENNIFTEKRGSGLGAVAHNLYRSRPPIYSLGLPTTYMPKNMTKEQIENPIDDKEKCAKKAISDIWEALGRGFNLVCPVRNFRAKGAYFSEPLIEGLEVSLWGGEDKSPNLVLGDYYHQQLKLIALVTNYQDQERKEDDDPILSFIEKHPEQIDPLFKKAYEQGKVKAAQEQVKAQAPDNISNEVPQVPSFGEPLTENIPVTAEFTGAFEKIYSALRDGQSGCFKTNFLTDKKQLTVQRFIEEIQKHAKASPNSRTAKALRLAKQYARNGEDIKDNTNLFKEIYTEAFAASGFGLFRQSKITGKTIWKLKKLKDALNDPLFSIPTNSEDNSRTMAIKRALNP